MKRIARFPKGLIVEIDGDKDILLEYSTEKSHLLVYKTAFKEAFGVILVLLVIIMVLLGGDASVLAQILVKLRGSI